MKFGSREIVDVVFRAKSKLTLGSRTFYKNDPVIYFDTLKTSSLEGSSSTVYAQGGRGNARLIAWDGDRTLTLNMEDALLTPESFTVLAGASLNAASEDKPIYVHATSQVEATTDDTVILGDESNSILACWNGTVASVAEFGKGFEDDAAGNSYLYNAGADIYVMRLTDNGEMEVEPCVPAEVTYQKNESKTGKVYYTTTIKCHGDGKLTGKAFHAGDIILVDYYIKKITSSTIQIEITPDILSTYFYIEGSTLYRRESDGVDMPAEVVIPKGKVQSNFTVSMAATGDPSTFSFVVDTFPDYTKFDKTKKVQAVIQIVEDATGEDDVVRESCKDHEDEEENP
jgi:hypothetical protein